MTRPEFTLYEVAGGAARITLNRPEARNALSAGLVNELCTHLRAAGADPSVRTIVLAGSGPAFCAGADLKDPPGASPAGGRSFDLPDLLTLILESPKPVVAAVHGAAFAGGLGLVAAADIAIVAEDAPMSFSEVRLGVIPAIISVVCLPKLGRHNAMKLFLTGERFDGRAAVSYGLAHRAVPGAELNAVVSEMIGMIRMGAPNAVAEAKRLVREIEGLPPAEAFALAAPWSARLFDSEEGREGLAAFREKRKPAWAV
jgi:methylglutaconyl-CoA hydratase